MGSALPRFFAVLASSSIVFAACGGGGGGGSVAPTPTSTPTPVRTPTPAPTATSTVNEQAFQCPTSDAATSIAQSGGSVSTQQTRRASGLRVTRGSSSIPGRLAVVYSAPAINGREAVFAAREQAAGGTLVQSFAFSHLGEVMHVLAVPAAQMSSTEAALRSQAGVVSVAPTGAHRFATSVTTPYFPSDPYFNGFSSAQNGIANNPTSPPATPAASTQSAPPYYESNLVPGQWDMHAIQLEYAFGYSQMTSVSGAPISNPSALGSSSVKLAIIDTGEDSTHPELASKIVYQRCFITDPSGKQSSSNFETDPLGHGTDVTGIAAAATNNGLGFVGAGGKTSVLAYRVFPTPDDNCANDNSTDAQCGSDTSDIAAAIEDAIAQGAKVISMSLGGDTCGTGSNFAPNGDSDIVEGHAVADAIAANVIVVAASGNSGGSGVASPACDSGVIAVGATGLADGITNGSNVGGGTVNQPVEYVTSYTQYGTTNSPGSSTSWGIVAPGGDPTGTGNNSTDDDSLHWIENIWTSTPYKANAGDTNFEGNCDPDYPNTTATSGYTIDCRTLIAGTSMATPHVAGVAALVLAVNPQYQSPTAMKTLLCQTADNLANPAHQGCGRLDAYRALAMALNDTNPGLPSPGP